MPIFKPIEEDEATGKVKEIFDNIIKFNIVNQIKFKYQRISKKN